MNVSVEKTSSLGRRLTIEVPAASIKAEEQNRIKHLSKNLAIDGFRRTSKKVKNGKKTKSSNSNVVPTTFIENKYGKQVYQEAISEVLQKTLGEALQEQNLRPANRPNVEDLKDTPGENLIYTVSFEVYPEINLSDLSVVELEKEVAEISDEDINNGVKRLQNQFATWQDITDRPAQNGDKLTIDFVGLLNGEAFEHGSANDQTLELGSKSFIPGFEEGLIGATVGATPTLILTFPENYGAAELAGKEVQFNVTVKKIQAKVEAIIDAEFAGRIGIEDKDVTKITAKVAENMQKYVDDLTKTRLREQAIDKLYETIQFDLPESLIEQEKHNLIHEKLNKAADDHNHDLTPEQDIEFSSEAKKRVAIGLLLNEIITKNDIKPEEERILAKVGAMSMMYGGNADFIRKMYMESKELRQSIQNMVLTDQAADFVVANATIKEKKSSFYDIVDRKAE